MDHISAYMDGFKMWKILFEEGIQGVIRGDEGFGWDKVTTSNEVPGCVGLKLLVDFPNVQDFKDQFGAQSIPESLQRQNGESLETWRDRLYHDFRMPCILAALSDLKLSYVEILSPLLFNKLIRQVRTILDPLRTNKTLFKEIVDEISPEIPIAKSSATKDRHSILKHPEVMKHLYERLDQLDAKELLGVEFINYILHNIQVGAQPPGGLRNYKN